MVTFHSGPWEIGRIPTTRNGSPAILSMRIYLLYDVWVKKTSTGDISLIWGTE